MKKEARAKVVNRNTLFQTWVHMHMMIQAKGSKGEKGAAAYKLNQQYRVLGGVFAASASVRLLARKSRRASRLSSSASCTCVCVYVFPCHKHSSCQFTYIYNIYMCTYAYIYRACSVVGSLFSSPLPPSQFAATCNEYTAQ